MTDATQLTPEEIQQYREQLKDNPEAIAQLNIIERCGGNLEQATRILARRADFEEVRAGITWETALNQAREVICNDNFKDGLAPDLISGVIAALVTAGDPLLVAVATPCASYIVKTSLAKFCKQKQLESED
ncbi:hypothetical protein [Crocosphaera sp. XPORK-15E]|uniref:hypothetical protein n=1 Tax=Crocosphaera sp. XPORK-15E TaxID=3110247 RepID=UPI002B1EED2D|nr:hypothetical protein [Crocosphaera sp. XPORK-15E]MEA5534494.1 hypothetical protein [Crocosphaera sp. XPORK-15E]